MLSTRSHTLPFGNRNIKINGLKRLKLFIYICIADLDYYSHIDYHWGGEGLRKTLVGWASSINDEKGVEGGPVVAEDESGSAKHCYSFKVKDPALVPPVKELRKSMRIHALRSHVIYCQNGTKMNVIPVLASRCQVLVCLMGGRIVKYSAGTDYEGLIGGIYKTVILKGICIIGYLFFVEWYMSTCNSINFLSIVLMLNFFTMVTKISTSTTQCYMSNLYGIKLDYDDTTEGGGPVVKALPSTVMSQI
ncbi:hypothetical protein HYC85_022635 [Camellia sinensis]|uniref:Uncharacterized protein n=1 Tax=Camellia sinensis TaxID=4442 RepID=A0A7J7GG95_CAMSI|nr:hypothetical protein HYC85_022635 [Camellia sinensis]